MGTARQLAPAGPPVSHVGVASALCGYKSRCHQRLGQIPLLVCGPGWLKEGQLLCSPCSALCRPDGSEGRLRTVPPSPALQIQPVLIHAHGPRAGWLLEAIVAFALLALSRGFPEFEPEVWSLTVTLILCSRYRVFCLPTVLRPSGPELGYFIVRWGLRWRSWFLSCCDQ